MRLVFYLNYLNHHQAPVMNEFFILLGEDFRVVTTLPRNNKELKGGKNYDDIAYCIFAGESDSGHQEALRLAREADVCVFGACSQEYAIERARRRPVGLSFEMGERWLKRGWINILSPTFLRWCFNYARLYRTRPFYKLCCSGYTALDDNKLGVYHGRHYKWGYFTKVEPLDVPLHKKNQDNTISIMWCARFIALKHPELVVELAHRLANNHLQFQIDFYGAGDEMERIKRLCCKLGVDEFIHFKGMLPNEKILSAMREHDVFLFTSDRMEGWGAVANEAMSNKCCLVISDEIGCVPFLIEDNVNAVVFKSKSSESLYEKVRFLVDNPSTRSRIAERAYQDMAEKWSPQQAAKNFLSLVDNLQGKGAHHIVDGPCSLA